MNKQAEIFKPGIAALKELAEKYKGLQINGVEDETGYKIVKDARKELGDMRILITKFGKSKREEAIAFQKEVIRQEREHLEIITPLEDELKAKIAEVDEARKKEERKALLPSRKAMLEEIKCQMTDDEILNLDEKQFSEMYTAKKMEHLEAEERKRKEEEDAKRRAEELEKAKTEAAEKAVAEEKARAERERIAAEEKAEKERKAEIAKAEQEEADRKAEIAKTEKNRKYKAWLKENSYTNDDEFKVERNFTTGEFTLYKKISSIIIK